MKALEGLARRDSNRDYMAEGLRILKKTVWASLCASSASSCERAERLPRVVSRCAHLDKHELKAKARCGAELANRDPFPTALASCLIVRDLMAASQSFPINIMYDKANLHSTLV